MVIPSAKATEVPSMYKIKNAQHFDIQTVLYERIQENISLLYLDDQIQQPLASKKRNPVWDLKKQTEP